MLEIIEIFHGTFNLIVVIINLIIGIRIASRYFKHKSKNFILVGVSWIGLASTYLPSSIKFLMIILFNIYLSDTIIFILNHAFLPPFTICWLIAITDLLNVKNKNRNIILGLVSLISFIFETLFFIFIFTGNLDQIGRFTGVFTVEWSSFSIIYLFFFAIVVLVSGIIFARGLLRAESPELKLKGKLIIIAFISFMFGALVEVILPLSYLTLIITRIILVSSSFEFYMGFMLPEWVKKILKYEEYSH